MGRGVWHMALKSVHHATTSYNLHLLQCRKDGKPVMIPGGVSKAVRLKLSQVFRDVSSEDEDEGGESAEESTDDDGIHDTELKEAIEKIKTTWKYLSTPTRSVI